MEFLEKNIKGILGVIGLIALAGVIATVVSHNSTKKEIESQEKFFAIDAKVKKYKEDKFKSESTKNTDKKDETAVLVKIDINQLKSELESFINENTGTVATQMAGLELADLLISEEKTNEALSVLQKIETKTQLLSNILVKMKLAQIFADQDKCSEALTIWNKILSSKNAAYLHSEVKINQALCYRKMNELVKAEEILNQVKNEKTDETGLSNQEADRILRLIQFKKSFGT